jgi:hypothetical protein
VGSDSIIKSSTQYLFFFCFSTTLITFLSLFTPLAGANQGNIKAVSSKDCVKNLRELESKPELKTEIEEKLRVRMKSDSSYDYTSSGQSRDISPDAKCYSWWGSGIQACRQTLNVPSSNFSVNEDGGFSFGILGRSIPIAQLCVNGDTTYIIEPPDIFDITFIG